MVSPFFRYHERVQMMRNSHGSSTHQRRQYARHWCIVVPFHRCPWPGNHITCQVGLVDRPRGRTERCLLSGAFGRCWLQRRTSAEWAQHGSEHVWRRVSPVLRRGEERMGASASGCCQVRRRWNGVNGLMFPPARPEAAADRSSWNSI